MSIDSLRAALRDCEAIAARNNSTLFHATRALPGFRRDYFAASYAAMRVIDDLVDEEFLTLPPAEREAGRPAMRATIEAWRRQTVSDTGEGPLPESVMAGLRATVADSDLGDEPWNGLANALLEDAGEAAMPDWAAFERYAEGATVAPATILIYLLACVRRDGGSYRCELPEAPRWYAADLAVFCYLVHILRDLARDAGKVERLVTLPESVLETVGLTRQGLVRAVAERDVRRLDALAVPILARAEAHREEGRRRLDGLRPHLGTREWLSLDGLITVYERLAADFRRRYGGRLEELLALESAIRDTEIGSR